MPTENTLLRVEGLRVRRGGKRIIDGLSLRIDRGEPFAEFEVITRVVQGRAVPDGTDHDGVVLAADRYVLDDHVGQPPRDLVGLVAGCVGLDLGLLHLCGEVLGLGEKFVLAGSVGGRDLFGQTLLLGTKLLEPSQRAATTLVGSQKSVDEGRVLTAGALRGSNPLRIVANGTEI